LTYFLQRYKNFLITTTIYKKSMDIDEIIYILKRHTVNDDNNGELGEQDAGDAGGGTSTGGGGAYPAVTKWETGLTRSVANQIDYKAKWKDLNKITRGKANTLL
jgi:hypothetical protein